jgi:hypothetical protein
MGQPGEGGGGKINRVGLVSGAVVSHRTPSIEGFMEKRALGCFSKSRFKTNRV